MEANHSRLVIRHKVSDCIGCQLCAETAPQYFQMNEQGLAELIIGSERGVFVEGPALAIDQDDLDRAAEGCPVDIIRVDQR